MNSIKISDMYSLEHTIAKDYLMQFTYPWEALSGINEIIIALGKKLSSDEYDNPSENVWIHKTAKVFPSAYNRCKYRSTSLRIYKRKRSGGRKLRCGKFSGAEKCYSLQQRSDAAL